MRGRNMDGMLEIDFKNELLTISTRKVNFYVLYLATAAAVTDPQKIRRPANAGDAI